MPSASNPTTTYLPATTDLPRNRMEFTMTHATRHRARSASPRTATARVTVALAAAALALAGCSGAGASGGATGGTTTLNVGELGTAQVQKALLDAAGESDTPYDLKYSLYASGPSLMEVVPSGAVDFGFMADTPPIFSQVAKIPTKTVTVAAPLKPGLSTVEIVVPPGSPITSVADLAGKKVSLTEATIMQYTLARALEKAGKSYSDITPVNLPPTDVQPAFVSKQIDAAAILGPQLMQLKAQGFTKIGDGVGLTTGYEIGVATDAALADTAKSDAIVDYVQRYHRAREWANAHPQEWATVYAKTTGLRPEVASALVARESYKPVRIDDTVIAAQQLQADTFVRLGLLKEKVKAADEFDARFNDRFAPAAGSPTPAPAQTSAGV